MKWFLRRIPLFVVLFAGVCLAGSAAAAGQCLDPSPTAKAGKDPYAAIEVRDLTPAEQTRIRTLFKSLDGRWSGEASEMICTSVSDPQSRESDNYTVNADIGVNYYGDIKMVVNLHSAAQKTSFQELLSLFIRDAKLRLNNDSALGDVELIEIASDRIRFRKYILKTMKEGASLRQEFFYTLAVEAKGRLRVETTVYFQARLYSRTIWTLTMQK